MDLKKMTDMSVKRAYVDCFNSISAAAKSNVHELVALKQMELELNSRGYTVNIVPEFTKTQPVSRTIDVTAVEYD